MLINADAKALEWYAAVYLSQDPVGIRELLDGGVDQHSDNQERLGLPSRLIAKIFLFRLIFGGTAYAYANDPDFGMVGWKANRWQDAIDTFYDKYKGLYQWHLTLKQTVIETGRLVMPTGRIYTFEPYLKRGELTYPFTQVLNYPVQGLGADLMMLARISLFRRLRESGLSVVLLSTVHDSILLDGPTKEVDKVCELVYNVWSDLPKNFERCFKVPFNLPMRVEIQTGPNWGDMEDYHV